MMLICGFQIAVAWHLANGVLYWMQYIGELNDGGRRCTGC